MALPNPIPDNPMRWDGWKNYSSPNFYERLCLAAESNPGAEQIEENCRNLLVWWQKKLPLKNQPSNPLSQLLRAGLDEAPVFLVEARTELLNAESRLKIDAQLHAQMVVQALEEFKKILTFSLVNKKLTAEAEERLCVAGAQFGLTQAEMQNSIEVELKQAGATRGELELPPAPVVVAAPSPAPQPAPARAAAAAAADPFSDFRRILRLSKLCRDGEEMTDDQRDAMCNMGESLGLTGGQAEDLIDEYLEEAAGAPPVVTPPRAAVPVPVKKPVTPVVAKPVVSAPAAASHATQVINTTPLARTAERQRFVNFTSSVRTEMLLVTSGDFLMGSNSPDASENERPVTPVTVGCFFMSRFPVTNAQYEMFDPAHRSLRAPWADDRHPVVFVSSLDAVKFCQWLSQRENRKYRLPTEAEWEYAARGIENRVYPWGAHLQDGLHANFADRRASSLPWRDPSIDDGFAESAPVGSFPHGKSPFGIEDLSGNVFEWCLDFFEPYKGKPRVNPRGPTSGPKRVYRGGSWRSRISNLRASARHFNDPAATANDVGFRIVCECQ